MSNEQQPTYEQLEQQIAGLNGMLRAVTEQRNNAMNEVAVANTNKEMFKSLLDRAQHELERSKTMIETLMRERSELESANIALQDANELLRRACDSGEENVSPNPIADILVEAPDKQNRVIIRGKGVDTDEFIGVA